MRTLLISRAAASSSDSSRLQGEELLVVAGQVAQGGREDGHRRRVQRNVLELVLHALVQQLVGRQETAEPLEFVRTRQPPEDQQPRHLDEVGLVDELLDGDAAVTEDAVFAVDERDRAAADARIAQGRVVGDQARLVAELGNVQRARLPPSPSAMGSSYCWSPTVKIALSGMGSLPS